MQNTYSERLIAELVRISEEYQCDLFEATVIHCEENDLDEKEFISQLDQTVIDRIKQSAIHSDRVRKCVYVDDSLF